jgi:VWFA-related protein
MVVVDVQVVHVKNKTAAPALRKQDFQIFEDGAPQEIAFLSRDASPLSVVLLFDLTATVRPVLRRLASSAAGALTHLKPEDEVAVMTYAASAQLVGDFTTDRQKTMASIVQAAGRWSPEAAFFNEAVYQAALQFEKAANPASRRVIIWLTDNLADAPTEWMRAHLGKSVPKGELHTETQAIRALHESGITVFPMLLKGPQWVVNYTMTKMFEGLAEISNAPGDVHRYAEVTGGRVFDLAGQQAVDQRLAELIDQIRSRYTIGYRPAQSKPAGTYCKLRVALAPGVPLRSAEWSVLARAGYYRK